jgi:hypothetical protein
MQRRSVHLLRLVGSVILIFYLAPVFGQLGGNSFRHHWIVQDLPGNRDSGYGCPTLADFDRDGDLDFSFSNTGGHVYWFENTGTVWLRHIVGPIDRGQLGSVTTDVDGDGWNDIIIGGFWYRNSKHPRDLPFDRFEYDTRIRAEIHDMVLADMDGDGRLDVVALGDGDGWLLVRNPGELNGGRNDSGFGTRLRSTFLNDRDDIHAGFVPGGVRRPGRGRRCRCCAA